MSVHHRWVTFFWKKLKVQKCTALKLCRHILWTFFAALAKKRFSTENKRKIPSAKTFVHFFGDFSTWNASIGDVNHFLVSLIVVRHLFQCKPTSETHQKWIHKGIKKKKTLQNLVARHSDENPQKRNFKIKFWTENYTHDSLIVVVHGDVLFFSFAQGSPK